MISRNRVFCALKTAARYGRRECVAHGDRERRPGDGQVLAGLRRRRPPAMLRQLLHAFRPAVVKARKRPARVV